MSAQDRKVFEILYTTPKAADEKREASPEAVEEFLANAFRADAMTTLWTPEKDGLQAGPLDAGGSRKYQESRQDEDARSARSPKTVGIPRCQDGVGRGLSTPASAEEQLEIFQKASRFKHLQSAKQKGTQVHAKVDFIFYWVDRNPGEKPRKVEVMGDFSNWRPLTMKRIEDKEEVPLGEPPLLPDGTPPTHFLRRDVDPTS